MNYWYNFCYSLDIKSKTLLTTLILRLSPSSLKTSGEEQRRQLLPRRNSSSAFSLNQGRQEEPQPANTTPRRNSNPWK